MLPSRFSSSLFTCLSELIDLIVIYCVVWMCYLVDMCEMIYCIVRSEIVCKLLFWIFRKIGVELLFEFSNLLKECFKFFIIFTNFSLHAYISLYHIVVLLVSTSIYVFNINLTMDYVFF